VETKKKGSITRQGARDDSLAKGCAGTQWKREAQGNFTQNGARKDDGGEENTESRRKKKQGGLWPSETRGVEA